MARCFAFIVIALVAACARAQDPLSYHGGSILAMAGKECVTLIVDKRLGQGNNLVGDEACRALVCGPRSLLALRGLQGDVQTLLEDVDARLRLRRIEEGPDAMADPSAVASLVSILLYGGRVEAGKPGYMVEPVIAGLRGDGTPYLCCQDGLGSKLESPTFVVAGTAATALYGACEALYEPDLDADALTDLALAATASGLDRDSLSGRDVLVYRVTRDGTTKEARTLGPAPGLVPRNKGLAPKPLNW